VISVLAGTGLLAQFDERRVLDPEHPAIQYGTGGLEDRTTAMREAVDSGKQKLDYDPDSGYLRSILERLEVPLSSQVLVFSKTSFQAPHIYPRKPRAIYFNDDTSVGWVRGGDVVEIASLDPRQGVIFYAVDQEPLLRPKIDRRSECLQCHLSWTTAGVPGLVVRSVQPDRNGVPVSPSGGYITDHRSPLEQRWGGWFVTGTHGAQRHMGNFLFERRNPDVEDSPGSNVTDLSRAFDARAYLSPHSDLIALMVLEHQTRMTNLIVRAGYEARIAAHEGRKMPGEVIEVLVHYMLFGDETKLTGELRGTSTFAKEFASRGPKDSKGRSLRDFDLKTRIFRYPCSYLIYSKAFDALPAEALQLIYQRLYQVLTGSDQSARYQHLSVGDRSAILEILRETKPGLPDDWRKGPARVRP
jgi:hypothetical protein